MQDQIDKLRTLNGELCAEINEKDRRIRELESLLRDVYELLPRASWSSVDADQRASDLLGRIRELGMEVDG